MRTIPDKESLTVEFKSDVKMLSDNDLALAVVCLANGEGGELYIGVEDDGTVTGLHARHNDPAGLVAVVANRTDPSVRVQAEVIVDGASSIMKVVVPKAREGVVATSSGTCVRRRLDHRGLPECVPFLPSEFASRRGDLSLLDVSARTIDAVGPEAFDPLERARLRRLIEENPSGDKALLGLRDEDFDGALGFVRTSAGVRRPTLTGLLFLGREAVLREHVPTHEVAFQVLEGTSVRVNEFFRRPLLATLTRVEQLFTARLDEQEVMVGLFRQAIPRVDPDAFREAFANALVHRDYARNGAVHVRWESDALTISNPGGFVEGVSLDNLLVTPPMPRNPLLADVFKRIGLVERSGRGVDRIYEGLIRYGRPSPDYTLSTRTSVVVSLSTRDADIPFFRMVLESERRRGTPHQADVLVALSALRELRRVSPQDVAPRIQRTEARARSLLEELVEAGLAEPHSQNRERTYTLSAKVYGELDQRAEYLRQTRPDLSSPEEQVVAYVATHGSISRKEIRDYCRVSDSAAKRLLKRLVASGALELVGSRSTARYVAGPTLSPVR